MNPILVAKLVEDYPDIFGASGKYPLYPFSDSAQSILTEMQQSISTHSAYEAGISAISNYIQDNNEPIKECQSYANDTVNLSYQNTKTKITFSDFITFIGILITIFSMLHEPDTEALEEQNHLLQQQNKILLSIVDSADSDNNSISEFLEELKYSLQEADYSLESERSPISEQQHDCTD